MSSDQNDKERPKDLAGKPEESQSDKTVARELPQTVESKAASNAEEPREAKPASGDVEAPTKQAEAKVNEQSGDTVSGGTESKAAANGAALVQEKAESSDPNKDAKTGVSNQAFQNSGENKQVASGTKSATGKADTDAKPEQSTSDKVNAGSSNSDPAIGNSQEDTDPLLSETRDDESVQPDARPFDSTAPKTPEENTSGERINPKEPAASRSVEKEPAGDGAKEGSVGQADLQSSKRSQDSMNSRQGESPQSHSGTASKAARQEEEPRPSPDIQEPSSRSSSQPISPASMPGSASQSLGIQPAARIDVASQSNGAVLPKVAQRNSLSGIPPVVPKPAPPEQQLQSSVSPSPSAPASTPASASASAPAPASPSAPKPTARQPARNDALELPQTIGERLKLIKDRAFEATLEPSPLSKPIHPSLDETSTHLVIESVRNLLIAKEEFLGREELMRASRELARVVPYNLEAWRLHADLLISALNQLETRQIQPDESLRLLTVPLREADLRDAAEAALRECAHYASSSEQRIALIDEANRVRRRTWL
ncbi:MAG: hypothetical protein K2X93_12725 [Candidatus Obscuribacterales bacterium]|nr:hypothetical protein [Candidatus Obscuribacterales bacterium]